MPHYYTELCSSRAYTLLETAGIVERCRQTSEVWADILLMGPFAKKACELYDSAKVHNTGTDLDISLLKVEQEADEIGDFIGFEGIEFLANHPLLVGFAVLGKDLERYKDYGFSSRDELAGAVNALCIGDKGHLQRYRMGGDFFWRNKQYLTQLSNDNSGDLSVSQWSVNFPENWKKIRMGEGTGFGGGQHGWGPFLISVLKYAEAIDALSIPQIKDWREYAHGVGSFWGTIDAEVQGDLDPSLSRIIGEDILGEGLPEAKTLPIRVPSESFPYVQGDNLLFVTPWDGGDFSISTNYIILQGKLSKRGQFCRGDLPSLMEGIYRLYARNRSEVPKIMKTFLDGKPD